jgi:hypothetical protein
MGRDLRGMGLAKYGLDSGVGFHIGVVNMLVQNRGSGLHIRLVPADSTRRHYFHVLSLRRYDWQVCESDARFIY